MSRRAPGTYDTPRSFANCERSHHETTCKTLLLLRPEYGCGERTRWARPTESAATGTRSTRTESASSAAERPINCRGSTSDFLDTAIEINEAEVQLGQLATTKAQSDSVKTYAQMLVKDHSMALQKLQKLRSDTDRSTPTLSAEHQDLKTRLSRMSGSQFDRAYIDAMVTGHRDAVKLFEQEIAAGPSRTQQASKPTDSDVTSIARELLPTIKHHLEEGEKIQKTLT